MTKYLISMPQSTFRLCYTEDPDFFTKMDYNYDEKDYNENVRSYTFEDELEAYGAAKMLLTLKQSTIVYC